MSGPGVEREHAAATWQKKELECNGSENTLRCLTSPAAVTALQIREMAASQLKSTHQSSKM